jgi:hypothetical protein
MGRYYFDIRDGDYFVPDEEGMELPTPEAAWGAAALSLADLAMDAVTMTGVELFRRQVAVEVRDDCGPVLTVRMAFADLGSHKR